MPGVITADTSCLVILEKIGELRILQSLFGKVWITPEIMEEWGLSLPQWIAIKRGTDKNYQAILEASLDKGEASAIALAMTEENPLLIIDESKGRKLAIQLGISVSGSLGIIVEAKNKGIVAAVKPLLTKIQATNFHFSNKLMNTILEKANEL